MVHPGPGHQGADGLALQREQGVPGALQAVPGGEGVQPAGGEQGAHHEHQGQGGDAGPECKGEPHHPRPDDGGHRRQCNIRVNK